MKTGSTNLSTRGRAVGRSSTGTAFSTTSGYVPPTASTAPAPAHGRSSSKTESSPGRCRPPTIPSWRRVFRPTNRVAASVEHHSPGTCTAPSASSTRTPAGFSSTCGDRRKLRRLATLSTPGHSSKRTPTAVASTSRRAAKAASAGSPGTRRSRSPQPRSSTPSRLTDRTEWPGSPPSQPCPRSATPPAAGSSRFSVVS